MRNLITAAVDHIYFARVSLEGKVQVARDIEGESTAEHAA